MILNARAILNAILDCLIPSNRQSTQLLSQTQSCAGINTLRVTLRVVYDVMLTELDWMRCDSIKKKDMIGYEKEVSKPLIQTQFKHCFH